MCKLRLREVEWCVQVTGQEGVGSVSPAHTLDSGSMSCYGQHTSKDCGQQSFSKQDANRQHDGFCSRRAKRSDVSQIMCTDGSSWPPVRGEGAKTLTALLSCECEPVLYLSSSWLPPLLACGPGLRDRMCRVLSMCPVSSRAQGSEHCRCHCFSSAEWVSAWNYKAGTDRCISRCSREN